LRHGQVGQGRRYQLFEAKKQCWLVHRGLGDELKGTAGGSSGIAKRLLNAFSMAGSHASAEAANTSVASIKSASQTVLGSAVERSIKQRPSMRPICVQRMSHEDANAENDTRYRDELGHGFSPPCLTRKSSPGSLPDDFAELGKWFRRRGHS